MRNMQRWKQNEIEFLQENYPKFGSGFCSLHLNRTVEAITNKAQALKIIRDGTARYSKKETPPGYTHCWTCDSILPDGQFYKKTSEGKYGKKSATCRACNQIRGRHYYDKHKSNYSERRKNNPIHCIFLRLKASAKRRNIKFDLTEQELKDKWNTHCPIYKKELVFFSNSDWSPSVDRINNELGYSKDNIIVVSRRANIQKNNCSVTELKLLFEFYSSL